MTDDRTLEKVRKLLAKANALDGPERETFLDAANAIIAQNAITAAMLDATRTTGEKRKPAQKRIRLWDPEFEWSHHFYGLIESLAETNRCRVAWHSGLSEITVVGMTEDVEWIEMLWMNTFFQFVSKIQPSWSADKTLQENIFSFKHAGYKWKDIWEIGDRFFKIQVGADGGMPDGGYKFVPAKCGYMKSAYHRECKKQGVEPVGTQTFEAYRLTFTSHFVWRVQERLEAMRAANKKAEDAVGGSAVALYDASKLVEDEFFLLFPSLHPEARKAAAELSRKRVADAEARDAEYLASLSPEARRIELKRRADEERRQAKASERYYREHAKKRTYDAAGATAGKQAGEGVDLSARKSAATSGSRTEIAR